MLGSNETTTPKLRPERNGDTNIQNYKVTLKDIHYNAVHDLCHIKDLKFREQKIYYQRHSLKPLEL